MDGDLTAALKGLIEEFREGNLREGVLPLHGPGKPFDWADISLARFQSYRGRTEAALLEELEDLCLGGESLFYHTDDIIVHLQVT